MKKREGWLLDVKGVLGSEPGSQTQFELNQKLKLPEFEIIQPVKGGVTLTKINEHLLANFKVETQLKLNCDRCLQPFNKKVRLNFERIYTKNPKDSEQSPTNPDLTIEVGGPLTEEIILTQPIKNLCKPNCKGIK